MSMINIDSLHKINEDRLKNRIKIYDEILRKCHERIKAISKSPKGTTFCFYIIPNYVYGTPLYDINACIVYMVQCLIKNGFYVAYTHPNLLYISWFKKSNSIEYKKQSKPIKEKRLPFPPKVLDVLDAFTPASISLVTGCCSKF